MANLNRSAKSGSDWTTNDLLAYNIRVCSQSPAKFYNQPLPTLASLSSLDPNLLSSTLHTQGLSDETYRLLQYLDLGRERIQAKSQPSKISRGRSCVRLDMKSVASFSDLVTPFHY